MYIDERGPLRTSTRFPTGVHRSRDLSSLRQASAGLWFVVTFLVILRIVLAVVIAERLGGSSDPLRSESMGIGNADAESPDRRTS